jgi:hypothetical protein
MSSILLNYDYIYFASVDNDFIKNYNKFFSKKTITNGDLFKINNNNDKIGYRLVTEVNE